MVWSLLSDKGGLLYNCHIVELSCSIKFILALGLFGSSFAIRVSHPCLHHMPLYQSCGWSPNISRCLLCYSKSGWLFWNRETRLIIIEQHRRRATSLPTPLFLYNCVNFQLWFISLYLWYSWRLFNISWLPEIDTF